MDTFDDLFTAVRRENALLVALKGAFLSAGSLDTFVALSIARPLTASAGGSKQKRGNK